MCLHHHFEFHICQFTADISMMIGVSCFSSKSQSQHSKTGGAATVKMGDHKGYDSDIGSFSSTDSISTRSEDSSSISSAPSISVHDDIPDTNGESISSSYKCLSHHKTVGGALCSLTLAEGMLYGGLSDNALAKWRSPEIQEFAILQHRKCGPIKSIVAKTDTVFTAHHDGKIRVWKMRHHYGIKKLATIPTFKDRVMNILSNNKYVQIRRHNRALWIDHTDAISSLAVGADGLLYSASWDRTVKVWSSSDFQCIESFRAHDDAINALVVSTDGFVYTASADNTIKVWNRLSGVQKKSRHALVATLVRHKSSVNALALSSDGHLLYSGGCDRSLLVWKPSKKGYHMRFRGAMRGHTGAILCIATCEGIVCSGSTDKTVRVWRRGEGGIHGCVAVLEGHGAPVKSIAVRKSEDSLGCSWYVYSGDLHNELLVWLVSCSA